MAMRGIRGDFWAMFHAAWGKDIESTDRPKYDKEAWIYVQAKMEKYFNERATIPPKRFRQS